MSRSTVQVRRELGLGQLFSPSTGWVQMNEHSLSGSVAVPLPIGILETACIIAGLREETSVILEKKKAFCGWKLSSAMKKMRHLENDWVGKTYILVCN